MGRKPLLTHEKVLVAIQRWIADNDAPPSLEQLRRELNVGSKRTVFRYLEALEEAGAIDRSGGELRLLKPRAIGIETRAVPIVGRVPAGPLALAEENIEGWIRVPKAFAKPEIDRFFLLRVSEDSMNKARVNGERIEDGDLLLVRQRPTARTSDVVVALVDGETTVKRFAAGRGYCVLKPDSTNPKHKPIIVDGDFRVLGVVARVLKKGSELLKLVED